MILLYSGIIACDSLYVSCLDTGIGIYNGLFHSTAITHSFDLFIYIIGVIILLLTAFYPRNLEESRISYNKIEPKNISFSKNSVEGYKIVMRGIDAPQFTMRPFSTKPGDTSTLALPPAFISGLVDGDGSFSVSISKKSTGLG
jgi:hypothetical protein